MKIIILGAGQVGTSVAESLVSEANDITVVDNDVEHLNTLQERLDLRVVSGNAAAPSVLHAAGAEDADLLIAVTQSDQTNLCACRVAKTVFNIPTRIARLRSADYAEHPELLDDNNFAVDHSICPEQIVTDYIRKLIEFPEALQVLEFAEGMVTMIAVKAFEGGLLVGKPLKTIPLRLPNIDARVAAIFRRDQSIIPSGDTIIESGDEVFIIAATSHIRKVMSELRRMDKPIKRVIIAGGGNIGFRLARAIEKSFNVKLIERDRRRAEMLASKLSRALVLRGEADLRVGDSDSAVKRLVQLIDTQNSTDVEKLVLVFAQTRALDAVIEKTGESVKEALDHYRDVVHNPPDVQTLRRFYEGKGFKAMVLEFKGLSSFLGGNFKRTNLDNPELMQLAVAARKMQALLGVFRQSKAHVPTVESFLELNGILFDSYEEAASMFAHLPEGFYRKEDSEESSDKDNGQGEEGDEEGEKKEQGKA